MATKVLCALAAVLVDSPAEAVKLKEHISQQEEELLTNGLLSRACRDAARTTRMARTDCADTFIIDFCSFASGRLAVHTP